MCQSKNIFHNNDICSSFFINRYFFIVHVSNEGQVELMQEVDIKSGSKCNF